MVRTILIPLILSLSLLVQGSSGSAPALGLAESDAPALCRASLLPLAETMAPREIKARFEGTITSQLPSPGGSDEIWTIADVDVLITPQTIIEPQGYQAAPGDQAQVIATHSGGGYCGLSVTVRVGAIAALPVEFQGVIQEIIAGQEITELEIKGTRVILDASSEVIGKLAVGLLARVIGDKQGDASVLARSVATESEQEASVSVELEDQIIAVEVEHWVLGDPDADPEQHVKIWTGNAEIVNQAHVGLTAQVRGYRRADDSVDASTIVVEEIDSSTQRQFEGTVTVIEGDRWVIDTVGGAFTILLDQSTFVDEARAPATIGSWSKADTVQLSPGTYLAVRIRMERID
jgi:hypothetical protein